MFYIYIYICYSVVRIIDLIKIDCRTLVFFFSFQSLKKKKNLHTRELGAK